MLAGPFLSFRVEFALADRHGSVSLPRDRRATPRGRDSESRPRMPAVRPRRTAARDSVPASAWRPRPGQIGGVRGTVGADVRGRSRVLVALLTFPAADRVDGSTLVRAAQRILPVLCVSRSNKRDRSRCRPGDLGCAGGRRPSRLAESRCAQYYPDDFFAF